MYYKKKCPVPVYKQVFLSAGKPKLVLFCVSLTLTGLKTTTQKHTNTLNFVSNSLSYPSTILSCLSYPIHYPLRLYEERFL